MYIITEKDFNNKHRIRLEFLANYDIDIAYHLSKANVAIDGLNRKLVVYKARLLATCIKYED